MITVCLFSRTLNCCNTQLFPDNACSEITVNALCTVVRHTRNYSVMMHDKKKKKTTTNTKSYKCFFEISVLDVMLLYLRALTWDRRVGLSVCGGPSGRSLWVFTCSQSCSPFVLLQLRHPGH